MLQTVHCLLGFPWLLIWTIGLKLTLDTDSSDLSYTYEEVTMPICFYFVCFFYGEQITTETLVVSENSVTRAATFINFQTVTCTLPTTGSYRVAVSNVGGVNASSAFDFLVFDSACVICTAVDSCTILVSPDCFVTPCLCAVLLRLLYTSFLYVYAVCMCECWW